MLAQIRPSETARMLLQNHLLRLTGPYGEFLEFFSQFSRWGEQGRSGGGAVVDVDLYFYGMGYLRCKGGMGRVVGWEGKLTTSPSSFLYFFNKSPMTAREGLIFDMARRPWSYSFWASTMTRTLSFVVGLEGSTPSKLDNMLQSVRCLLSINL